MQFPYEQQAMDGEEMLEGLSLPDQCAYQFLRSLYSQYYKGLISKEQAIREKGLIQREYDVRTNANKYIDVMQRWLSGTLKAIEGAQNAYRKNRTLENADNLSAAIDGRLTMIERNLNEQ